MGEHSITSKRSGTSILSFFKNSKTLPIKSGKTTKFHSQKKDQPDDLIILDKDDIEETNTENNIIESKPINVDKKVETSNTGDNVKESIILDEDIEDVPKDSTVDSNDMDINVGEGAIESNESDKTTKMTSGDSTKAEFTTNDSITESKELEKPVKESIVTSDKSDDTVISDSTSNSSPNKIKKGGSKQSEKKKNKNKEKSLIKKQKDEEKLKLKQEREQERLRLKEQREEEKRKKDAEKQKAKEQRDEEKRKRDEAKLKAKQERELEKAKKEEEKNKKEEQKRKEEEAKERSQTRIASFFKKVSDKGKQERTKSDYESSFLPFYTREGVITPVTSLFSKDELKQKMNEMDKMLRNSNYHENTEETKSWLSSRYKARNKGVTYKAVTLLQQMTAKDKSDEELQTLLSLVPQKYIKFYENVRPPYIGTYSKETKLPIDNPFSTEGTDYNYAYDSDLEWTNEEEDADGAGVDNLESGEEDEEDEDEDDGSENEFDGFLDNEESNNGGNGRKKFIGPLIPTVLLRSDVDTYDADDKQYFHMTAAESLVSEVPLPIDPHQKIRTSGATRNSTDTSPTKRSLDDAGGNMMNNKESPEKKKAKTLITDPKDLLKLFDEIQDSTFSLGTVTEISQKSLPNYNKQIIKNTVKEYAIRGSGKGDTPRKWQIKDIPHWEQLRDSV
ncbi:chromatin assembly factor-I (CAF-I) p90 subunit [Maudiozyma exigua]|uniref:Chromatin assembly factor-I (CAF-I) p90 subunit n=1 Tax=Maudiozyma exigua TaxID=34358 RepID=A0A9P6WBZ5_MAUEX|nr:chromatin assembly factor-I (CAF-I) p90 subunit [Kazachstania exigua]